MHPHIRSVAGSRVDSEAWLRAVFTGFLHPPDSLAETMELRLAKQDFERAIGAFDGDRCVATFRSFDQELTLPGGALTTANAVSGVTVTATHRRRGLLSRMMARDLAAAKERGHAVATLVAAEFGIYGRFGFGPAAGFTQWRILKSRAGLDPRWSLPEGEGTLAFIDGAEVRKLGPELHDRFRKGQAGAIHRPPLFWERATGEVRLDPGPWREPFHALYRDAAGVPQGLVTFTTDDTWEAGLPEVTATVSSLFATTPAAESALWRFLLAIDWVAAVDTGRAPTDSILPLLLPDPRAALVKEYGDFLWLRPLDVPGLLGERGYATAGRLVIEVTDPAGLAHGRFLLDASPEGATVAATARAADLTLDAGTLARLSLGEESAARLVAGGLVDEETPGAAARADLLFRTSRRPWCPDIF
ncbi:GNAT family N-acetyltransferase [Streptomyces radicis]|uniref:GNAT family N-acetyltransferase n=1 Tax=Streptomyces radicis TaxID=1750517 RepID=A0A3A9WBQ1_9ACTN|nr:GNAT family N-acetyltransferase [Streptomyces radicis]RKN09753.1 GNAT family N-acetyltransferase [Streptomyces radicis]RKN23390.1 GNAT family N-acetyltransferase [Streptomyces radicis]